MNEHDVARLMTKFIPVDGSCWEWIGSRAHDGYGAFALRRKNKLAHRVVYEHFIGPIPSGMTIDHLCRNRNCVNPHHLEAVTNRVNTLRGIGLSAENAKKTSCVHGHPLSGENLALRVGRYGGYRKCKRCDADRQMRAYYERKLAGIPRKSRSKQKPHREPQ